MSDCEEEEDDTSSIGEYSDAIDNILLNKYYGEQLPIEEEEDDDMEKENRKWIWKQTNNIPTIWVYSGTPGIKPSILKQLGENPGRSNILSLIFDQEFWEILTNQTNRYAQHVINDNENRKKLDDSWQPVSIHEIKAFYALCILMTQVKKSSIQMYWSKKAVIETPIFRKIMPFNRFRQISRFLYFSDIDTVDSSDQLHKVRPIINLWNRKFSEIYTLEENVCMDESLINCKERWSYKETNSSKRVRFSVKIYKLCETSTGFCQGFKIWVGKNKISKTDSSSSQAVMELSKLLLNKGYTLFLNNWNSSLSLFLNLKKQKINVIGTIRGNRRNMPKDVALEVLAKGNFLWRSCNGLLLVRWKEKADIFIISTKHENVKLIEQTDRQYQNILKKPDCVSEFNEGMTGIVRQNQMLLCFPIMRKFLKGYRKLFFYMSDIALFNAYILQGKIHPDKKESYIEYRINIAELLLQDVQLPDYKRRGRPTHGETPLRLQAQHWAHFPKHIDATPQKKNPTRVCKVCSKNKIRSETTWECAKCAVALHVPNCFEKYHTMQDY